MPSLPNVQAHRRRDGERRRKGTILIMLGIILLTATAANAQPLRATSSVRVETTAQTIALGEPELARSNIVRVDAAVRDVEQDREAPPASVGRHALVGSILGATLGGVSAYLLIQDSGVTDHSWDYVYYMILVPTGALLGAALGGVVGFVRNR